MYGGKLAFVPDTPDESVVNVCVCAFKGFQGTGDPVVVVVGTG